MRKPRRPGRARDGIALHDDRHAGGAINATGKVYGSCYLRSSGEEVRLASEEDRVIFAQEAGNVIQAFQHSAIAEGALFKHAAEKLVELVPTRRPPKA